MRDRTEKLGILPVELISGGFMTIGLQRVLQMFSAFEDARSVPDVTQAHLLHRFVFRNQNVLGILAQLLR